MLPYQCLFSSFSFLGVNAATCSQLPLPGGPCGGHIQPFLGNTEVNKGVLAGETSKEVGLCLQAAGLL